MSHFLCARLLRNRAGKEKTFDIWFERDVGKFSQTHRFRVVVCAMRKKLSLRDQTGASEEIRVSFTL